MSRDDSNVFVYVLKTHFRLLSFFVIFTQSIDFQMGFSEKDGEKKILWKSQLYPGNSPPPRLLVFQNFSIYLGYSIPPPLISISGLRLRVPTNYLDNQKQPDK